MLRRLFLYVVPMTARSIFTYIYFHLFSLNVREKHRFLKATNGIQYKGDSTEKEGAFEIF